MNTLMIEKMNNENLLYEQIKSLFVPYMNNGLADLKTNEVMRLTGFSFSETSADDACPYCTDIKDEDGKCQCVNVR